MDMVIYKAGETNIQTTVIDGLCTCTGDIYYVNDVKMGSKPNLTVNEYLNKKGAGYSCISFDDAIGLIEIEQNKKYIKPFREITKEDWWEALEVLPPEKWQTKGDVEIFRMMEYQTGNITAHYARYGKKYYYANRNTNIDYDDIANEIKAL